jgi:hypothetical protein
MESNTIFTIETPELTAKLDRAEISIIHYIESWLPTFMDWNVEELSYKCNMFTSQATSSVDMLILHGLVENAPDDAMMGRQVTVTADGALWMRENMETINSLCIMNDTDLFDDSETALA